ncbi:histidine phosphatase family protein [Rhizobacter sp. Root404]|jgi:phosphohistidine phosphatase|uniref:SixA phosphatase family protein n=1 Tax=Rhizobacter sp. Root404 TaxID=1736528 RepID=UPI0006FBD865|nr:histidine phosphatase family protein [Rhizobacter sp. Root404]KQW35965.1 phosphohistidine phosphatase [Rhizobacter sp. Root404]
MDLILWRHAEAFELREETDDLARALTPKGERQAQRMGEWVNQRLAHSTRVLVSPALRCQQTAKALGRKFKTLAELGPDGNGEALLKAARWPDASEPVLIVGHQPTLGFVASYLLSDQPQNWTIKKGAVWWIRGRQREDRAQVILQAVQSPDCL